jgi:hypothetical protein
MIFTNNKNIKLYNVKQHYINKHKQFIKYSADYLLVICIQYFMIYY